MVVDADSGEVLSASNPDSQTYPASLTKMMTLYLLFDALDSGEVHLTDHMPVSAHASVQSPTKLGLLPGHTLMVEDAILGLCTKSANDAAVVVAEHLGGSESAFADMMTRKARELGMRQTVFRNASGLPNTGQVSSARDMVTLARALLRNHPREYRYFSTRQFVYNGEVIHNHNHLMDWYEGVDGIKTGFIGASGFNLVASVKRNGRRLIGVIFGGTSAPARDRQMAKLLDAAFARAPGPVGVQEASAPEPATPDVAGDATLKAKTKGPAVAEAADDARAVMKAMASSQAAAATPPHAAPAKPAHAQVAHARRADDDDDEDASGDAEDDTWGIQVGAYGQKAKATAAAQTALHKLGKLAADGEIKVARVKGHHVTYRARVVGFTVDEARAACRRLAKNGTKCAVINTAAKVALK
jgi:D-alanyl-D-alanine carboxypeptidase